MIGNGFMLSMNRIYTGIGFVCTAVFYVVNTGFVGFNGLAEYLLWLNGLAHIIMPLPLL